LWNDRNRHTHFWRISRAPVESDLNARRLLLAEAKSRLCRII
jgi:hypothetical protein